MQKSGRGYVIRFYNENKGMSLFLLRRYGLSTLLSPRFTNKLKDAQVFINNINAREYVIKISPDVKKLYPKGYLYISKVFYKPIFYPWNSMEYCIPTKLTKPDIHDFLQSL